ncbi:MAG: PilN domain-containing protein [Pseudomonadota bacterium]
MTYFTLSLNSQLAASRAEKDRLTKELTGYSKITQKVAKLKQEAAETRSKLEVIRELEKKKARPVQLLEEIAMAIPRGRLWLSSLDEKDGGLTLTGTAMDNNTVALFMTNLERTRHIKSVDLKSTRLKHLEKYKINVTDFVLICGGPSQKKEAEPKDKGKKRTRERRR